MAVEPCRFVKGTTSPQYIIRPSDGVTTQWNSVFTTVVTLSVKKEFREISEERGLIHIGIKISSLVFHVDH